MLWLGVQGCVTDMRNQKVMVAGNFDLEKVLRVLNKKIGREVEILEMTKKADVVPTEDDESDIAETNDKHDEIVAKKNEEEDNDDNPKTRSIILLLLYKF